MPKKKGKEEQTLDEKLKMAIVPKEEEPYKVPDNWIWTRLENLGQWGSGGTPSRKISEYYKNGTIPWLKTGDLNDDIVYDTEEYITEIAVKSSSAKIFKKGSIGIAMYGATIGKIGIFGKDMSTNQACAVIKVNELLESGFLFYFFKNIKQELIKSAKGGAQPNISQEILKKFYVCLPPIEEQKRIVNKLDYFFDKIQKVKEIIEEVKGKNEARKESILSKAFTGELTAKWRADNIHRAKELLSKINDEKLSNWEQECQKAEAEGRKKPTKPKLKSIDEMIVPNDEIPYEIPNNWIWTRLGDISEVNPKKVSLSYDDEEQISFVPMKAVSEITGKIEDLEFERYGKLKKGYTQFIEEDVLFAKITPCMENGKCAIAKNLKDKVGYGTTEFHVLRTNKYFDNRFLFNFLRQESFRKDAQYHMTGSVGFRRVPTEYLKEFIFPLPPIEEQKEIVRILDNIFTKENLINELISLEDKIQALEKSILSKTFRGELGTNSKDDIEAMELLKEIL